MINSIIIDNLLSQKTEFHGDICSIYFVSIELGRRSIYHATHRDAYSGGIVRVYHIKPTGWVNISNEDCMELHYKYKAEKEAKLA